MLRKVIVSLHKKGLTSRQIASRLRRSPTAIGYHLRHLGLRANGYHYKNPNLEELRRLHKKGLTNRAIANQLGISHTVVRYYLLKFGLRANGPTRHKLNVIKGQAVCSKCKRKKPTSDFLLHKRSSWNRKSYRLSYCKECLRKQKTERINGDWKKVLRFRFAQIRAQSKSRSTKFNLSFDDICQLYEQQKKKCFYTNAPMVLVIMHGRSRYGLSFDRIIPSRGYVKDNVVLCTNIANRVKNDMTLEEMKKWIPAWYKKVMRFLAG